MKAVIFDPPDVLRHQYLTEIFFKALRDFIGPEHLDHVQSGPISQFRDRKVILNGDRLNPETLHTLRENGNQIVAFSCTDSSWISQACREASELAEISLVFCLTGIQKKNIGHELEMTPDRQLVLNERKFLPDSDWKMFRRMADEGRIQSLPYVHWHKQPAADWTPWSRRSQKALIRGGNHMRRFLLALDLLRVDKLDCNSGFFTAPCFSESMNPAFRYCGSCRSQFSSRGHFPPNGSISDDCTNPAVIDRKYSLDNLNAWNNRCPAAFVQLGVDLGLGREQVASLMNGRYLSEHEHVEMLARMAYTSDLKWLFSIYLAQRFWDAAATGCVNILPSRTADQDYFPAVSPGVHYWTFDETMGNLREEFSLSQSDHIVTAMAAKQVYDDWIKPTNYVLNTNLIQHMVAQIKHFTT